MPLTGVTVGNALIIGAHSNASFGQTLSSITEGSDTCAIDVSSTSGSFPTDADSIGHCFNVSTTTPTVVAHFTGGFGTCRQVVYAVVSAPLSSVDKTATNTTTAGAVCNSGTTATTSNAKDFVLAMCSNPGTNTLSSGPTNGFTELADPFLARLTPRTWVPIRLARRAPPGP